MDSDIKSVPADFHAILDEWEESNDSYFLTGKAGTGKSTLLKIFRKTTQKKIAVLAPTGMAAVQVQGQTIHSFLKLPPRLLTPSDLSKPKNWKLLKKLDAIVIDEISMVRADLLDAIDQSLRLARGNDQPFGGLQMLLFGDVFQLPPVISTNEEKAWFDLHYNSPYFFDAHCLEHVRIHSIVLDTVYRQSDTRFIHLLDSIRHGEAGEEILEEFNRNVGREFGKDDIYITICSHNYKADAINQIRMQALPGTPRIYNAEVTGNVSVKQMPVDTILTLKEGAQVIFVKNDPRQRFVNGTLGVVTGFTEDGVIVEISNAYGKNEEIEVTAELWEIIRYKIDPSDTTRVRHEVTGSFKQIPLKPAWAITIHKSQGQSYDRVKIDLGKGAFEYGQTYVALSRCRTFEGISLSKALHEKDIMVDPRIVEFFESHRWS